MKVCVLDNDVLDPVVAPTYVSYGAMLARLMRDAGAEWSIDIFNTTQGHYPDSFADYDAVMLTGSKADSFSQEPWVVELRQRVAGILAAKQKLVGVCFGHQLVGLCLGAKVGRAPQGWGSGRMTYQWHDPEFPQAQGREEVSLLASHQDQVLELPAGARLLASSDFCPVAAFAVDDHVFCVQAHPEFVEAYSGYILNNRRESLGETVYQNGMASLSDGHDGADVARMMVAFVEGA
jgi:GMP synthase-like glutamine amidotransferase